MPHCRFGSLVSALSLTTGLFLVPMPGHAAKPAKMASPVPTKLSIMQDPMKMAIAEAVARVKPALVRIHVVSTSYGSGREEKGEGYGSGVIISPQGYIITNHHVAGNAVRISCTLATKEEVDATLVGTDPLSDIAVIRLLPTTPRTFPCAKFGDSTGLRVGDRVFAMGSPLAFSQSVTMGVVSNTELILPEIFGDETLTLEGEDVGSIVRWIGHDAEIFPGNSGGPLVNLQGEIVGINEISIGLSGAIPGNLARASAQQLIANGKVKRAWLGLNVQPLLNALPAKHGILIADVDEGSPADAAGFTPGDILLKINNQTVDVRYKEELPLFNQMVMALPIGKRVDAVVLRGGKTITVHATPLERQTKIGRPGVVKAWGICAATIHDSAGVRKTGANLNAVVVVSLRPGGPADSAKPALAPGDFITEINGTPIHTLEELQAISENVLASGAEHTAMTVSFLRNDDSYLSVINVDAPGVQGRELERRKAWLPVGFQVLTADMAKALGIAGTTGVRITQLYPGTSSEQSGLQVGDIITALDGEEIQASQPEDTDVLPAMIRQYKIGSTVSLAVLRNKESKTISMQLGESPRPPREMKRYQNDDFDFTVRDIAFQDRVEDELSTEQHGVIVDLVGEGGWAALGRLHVGDLICAVNGTAVGSVDELRSTLTVVSAKKPRAIILQVLRHAQNCYLELHCSWPGK